MAVAAYAGPDSDLAPDAQTIAAFIKWWFGHCNRGQIEIGWLDPEGLGLIHFERFELNSNEIVPRIIQINLVPGQSVYFRASTVNTISGFSKDENFVQAPGVWGDIDTPDQMERAKAVQTIVRPNGSVVTGTIPNLRVQSWFRVSEPIVNPNLVRSLNRRIHKLYGGDSAVVNPTRLMRMPGTIAWPWKDERVPELTKFMQATDRIAFYPLAMLVGQLPAEEGPAEEKASTGNQSTPPPSGFTTASGLIHAIKSGQQWHNNLLRLVAHWIGRGWSDAEIIATAEGLTLPGWTVTDTRKDMAQMIESGRAKWGVPDNDPIIASEPASPFPSQVVDFWHTLQAPEFPIHALPGALRSFVEARSRVMGGDPCALAWAALSACSAALDGNLRLTMKRHEPWFVPPGLWVALIGDPSTKKSPIIAASWRPLEQAQAADLRQYAIAKSEWERIPKKERTGEGPPPPRRLLTHDATMESLQEILAHQTRGIGVLRDELSGFIAGMDRYANGKGGSERAFFLQAWNGGHYVADRIGRGTSSIDNLLVTICGGIQPDKLAQFGDLTDDGLWQRFIPIIVRSGEMDTDEPVGKEVDDYHNLISRLLLTKLNGKFILSDPAHSIRERVTQELFELERGSAFGAKFSSFVGKLPGVWGRLALVLSQIEPYGVSPHIVHEEAAERSRVLVMRCALQHAANVYATIGDHKGDREHVQTIAGYILAKHSERLLASDLGRKIRVSFRTLGMSEINKLLSPLVAGGWLAPESDLPSNKSWLVNPLVHTTFGSQAEVEKRRRHERNAIINGDEDDEL